VRFTRGLRRTLRRTRPDVVWACGIKAALLAAAACRAERVPIVWHKVDASWDHTLAIPVGAAVDGVVTVSSAVAEALGPLRARRMLGVVGVPITLPDELAADPDPAHPVIGTLARFVPYKGLHHMVAAAAILREEFPTLRLLLAGADAAEYPRYRVDLEEQAAAAGIADAVELPGFVADVGSLLTRFSVFLSATYRDEQGFGLEGLGAAALEASWVGVPVVAARGGGITEAVEDGVTGTLVDAPEPAALAAAVAPYLRDPELHARVGQAGRAFARRRYSPEASSSALFSALARAAARRRPPSR